MRDTDDVIFIKDDYHAKMRIKGAFTTQQAYIVPLKDGK
jgi:hypothetical protein